jgi:hypothetical protein
MTDLVHPKNLENCPADPAEEYRDNCGFGLLAHLHHQPSHQSRSRVRGPG